MNERADRHFHAKVASFLTLRPGEVSFVATSLTSNPREFPRLAASLLWMNTREEAFLGERPLSVGRQSAFERVGHFFVELYHRLSLIGPVPDRAFDCPLTLDIVADAIGMSMVHASRTLQVLRRARLLAREGRTVRILDLARLERETDFAGLYLGRRLGAGELFLQPKFEGA